MGGHRGTKAPRAVLGWGFGPSSSCCVAAGGGDTAGTPGHASPGHPSICCSPCTAPLSHQPHSPRISHSWGGSPSRLFLQSPQVWGLGSPSREMLGGLSPCRGVTPQHMHGPSCCRWSCQHVLPAEKPLYFSGVSHVMQISGQIQGSHVPAAKLTSPPLSPCPHCQPRVPTASPVPLLVSCFWGAAGAAELQTKRGWDLGIAHQNKGPGGPGFAK